MPPTSYSLSPLSRVPSFVPLSTTRTHLYLLGRPVFHVECTMVQLYGEPKPKPIGRAPRQNDTTDPPPPKQNRLAAVRRTRRA